MGTGRHLRCREKAVNPSSTTVPQTEDIAVEAWGSTLLLVEDDPDEANHVEALLQRLPAGYFEVTQVKSVTDAQVALERQDFSAVLLDLAVPDEPGLRSIERVRDCAPDVPLIVLGGWEHQPLALHAVRRGAQDFLIKPDLSSGLLGRSLRYAIERKRAEARFAYLARYDQLTHLPNRELFQARLSHALVRAELSLEQVALLVVNVDGLDDIITAWGEEAHREVLREVSARLTACVRQTETVARLGTCTFGVVLEGVGGLEDASIVSDRIVARLGEPFDGPVCQLDASGQALNLTARVGIAVAAGPESIETMLERADHHRTIENEPAKKSADHASSSPDQRSTDHEAREALARNEFKLLFQPRVVAADGAVVAVEAFLRWSHPRLGLLVPHEFLDQIADLELVERIHRWVVVEAARQLGEFRQACLPKVRLNINLDERHLWHIDSVEQLTQWVSEAGAEPSWIELDCEESVLLSNPARSRRVLRDFQAAGFRTAMDSFGAGIGQLSELASLPLDALKIDRAVTAELDEHPARRALFAAAVAVGRELALEVVTLGVEREAQAKLATELGATHLQGYWIAEPKSAPALAEWSPGWRGPS